jgi:hypothetical protein
MIQNDKELEVTQERIKHFLSILQMLRQSARPEEFEAVSSGYRLEIERMHSEVKEYRERSAWQRERDFIEVWIAKGPVAGGRAWTREELYDRNLISH